METVEIIINNTSWTEVLADGGSFFVDKPEEPILMFVGSAAPAGVHPAHYIEPRHFNGPHSFINIPAGSKVFLRSVYDEQPLVISK